MEQLKNGCWAGALALLVVTACDDGASAPPDAQPADAQPSAEMLVTPDSGVPQPDAGGTAPGGVCNCDTDCQDVSGQEGACMGGICTVKASADCSGPGSTAECPAGFQCWHLRESMIPLCFPNCSDHDCQGNCDEDGICLSRAGLGCDPTCGLHCVSPGLPCVPTNPAGVCDPGKICAEGQCEDSCSATAPAGYCHPGFQCTDGVCLSGSGCGTWECTDGDAACREIIQMPGAFGASSPEAAADSYFISCPASYGFLRRDLTLLIRWAACEMKHLYPDLAPVGLGDFTQSDGVTPGCPTSCRHPEGSHTGNDFDAAYMQTDGSNDQHIICGDGSDDNANGVPGQFNDGFRCTTQDHIVQVEQQVRWFSLLAHHPGWDRVGIDTTLLDDFQLQAKALHDAALIDSVLLSRITTLSHESALGWDYHHHHTHFKFRQR